MKFKINERRLGALCAAENVFEKRSKDARNAKCLELISMGLCIQSFFSAKKLKRLKSIRDFCPQLGYGVRQRLTKSWVQEKSRSVPIVCPFFRLMSPSWSHKFYTMAPSCPHLVLCVALFTVTF